jgi:hypothetical protein
MATFFKKARRGRTTRQGWILEERTLFAWGIRAKTKEKEVKELGEKSISACKSRYYFGEITIYVHS